MAQLGDYLGPAKVTAVVVTVSAAGSTVLAANPGRTKIIFQSGTPETWYISYTGVASLASHTVKLLSGTMYVEMPPIHTGSVSVTQAEALGPLLITEFSKPDSGYASRELPERGDRCLQSSVPRPVSETP